MWWREGGRFPDVLFVTIYEPCYAMNVHIHPQSPLLGFDAVLVYPRCYLVTTSRKGFKVLAHTHCVGRVNQDTLGQLVSFLSPSLPCAVAVSRIQNCSGYFKNIMDCNYKVPRRKCYELQLLILSVKIELFTQVIALQMTQMCLCREREVSIENGLTTARVFR